MQRPSSNQPQLTSCRAVCEAPASCSGGWAGSALFLPTSSEPTPESVLARHSSPCIWMVQCGPVPRDSSTSTSFVARRKMRRNASGGRGGGRTGLGVGGLWRRGGAGGVEFGLLLGVLAALLRRVEVGAWGVARVVRAGVLCLG